MAAAPRARSARPQARAQLAGLELARALGNGETALSLLALRLAEPAGFLPQGTCAKLAALEGAQLWPALVAEARALRLRTGGALPPWPLRLARPTGTKGPRARVEALLLTARLLAADAPAPDALCFAAEAQLSTALGLHGRRAAGLYYTPPGVAEQVVDLALAQGSIAREALPAVQDPCAGAGIFLAAAARALTAREGTRLAALRCAGADLDPAALRVARAQLALCAGPAASARDLAQLQLACHDSLRTAGPLADLLVSNPPYGHIAGAAERAFLALALPALRGGEIDRYSAFLLRSLALIREGGTAALLIPDTWMTNARSGSLRAAVLEAAEIAAIADLGKPFLAARDTRVQALVLVRRAAGRRKPRPTFAARAVDDRLVALSPLTEHELRATAPSGWQPYRSHGERALCAALEAASIPLRDFCAVGYGLRTGRNALYVEREAAREGEIALCGGEDIVPFALRLRPKRLAQPTPALLALAHRQLGRERIAVQRIRTNSALPWARWLEAAPVPPGLVCLDSLSTLACADDAAQDRQWALLALLHSVALNRFHRLCTTDVNVKPSLLRELPVPRALLRLDNAARLAALARARSVQSREQARTAPTGRISAKDVFAPELERAIDRAVYDLYDLPAELIAESERGFWGTRFEVEHGRLPRGETDRMSDPPRIFASIGRSS